MKSKAYMEARAKLLESGGKVIQAGGGATKKWMVKAETKGYNAESDFVSKKRQKTE